LGVGTGIKKRRLDLDADGFTCAVGELKGYILDGHFHHFHTHE
jgi:hypothetical protein